MKAHSKTRASSGRLQQHHRTSSGGSSKVGLNNLALTQKDPAQQNLKRTATGHSAAELHQGKQHPRAAHLTANQRARSKDQIATAQRRGHAPPSTKGKQQQGHPQRPNFSIARSDDSTDSDDEWVSSESGAATPHINSDPEAQTQRDQRDVGINGHETITPGSSKINGDENGANRYGSAGRETFTATNGQDGARTPRAEVDSDLGLTRVETARPDAAGSLSSSSRVQAQVHAQARLDQEQQQMKPEMEPLPAVRVQALSSPATPVPLSASMSAQQPTDDVKLSRHAHSETPSPEQLRRKTTVAGSRRTTVTRNNSHSYGEKKLDLHNPPHPLIRGPSFQRQNAALRPARLAPLTVNSEAARAQLMATPSSAITPSRAESPTLVYTKSPSDASTASADRLPSRKASTSSLHSIATLPAPTSRRFVSTGKQDPNQVNRTRTLSTLSTSSSSAALNALSTLPSISRPSSPPLVVRFPADSRGGRANGRDKDRQGIGSGMVTAADPHEGIHQLLPPPYFGAHMTVRQKHNPLFDCWERVMQAKQGQAQHEQRQGQWR